MSQPKRDTMTLSPLRLVLVLLLAIFTIEFGIMTFLLALPPDALNGWVETVIDSSVLSALLFPVLFFAVFRPLSRQVKELEQAKKELERTGEALQHHQRVLEQTVAERTERLATTTERLSLVLDAIEEGVWDWQVQSGELYNSPTWARMLGYAPEELGGRLEDYTRCLLDEEKAAVLAALDAHIAAQTPRFYSEHRMRCKDGRVIWVEDRGRTVAWDEQGRPRRMVGAMGDITARKQAELQLRNSEQRYRQILQTSMDGFWLVDTEGRILDVNDAYCQLSGYSRDELLHMRIPDLEAQETPEDTGRHIQEILKQGHTRFETRHRCKDGQLLDMEVSVLYGMDKETGSVFLHDITERKRAERELVVLNAELEANVASRTESLRQARERLEFLLRATPAVIYAAKAGGDYPVTFISANVRAILGWEPEDFLRDPAFWSSNIHPDDRERVFAALAALETEDRQASEYRFRHRDGSWPWVHDDFMLIRDSSGAPSELVGYWIDVTERKKAADALRESESRHTAVIASALDAIIVNDDEGRITGFNPAAERTFGRRRDEVVGKNLAELLIPAGDGGILRQRFRDSLARGMPEFGDRRVEVSALHADGHEFPVELTVQRIDWGGHMYFTAFVRDISESKRAQHIQARLVSILDATPDFAGFADAKDTRILYINPAGRKMIGLGSEEDVTRLKIADCHPEWTNKLFRDEIIPTAMRDGVWTGECVFVNRDGRDIPVMMVLLAHKSPTGEVEWFSTISRDITEHKRTQAAVAEASRAKSEFMNNVTHELRTPLNAVIGFAELLKDEVPGPLNAKQAAFVSDILASGERLLALVEGILEMSRLDAAAAALEREPIEIGSALTERVGARRAAAEAQRVSISLEVAADVGSVELDPTGLRRMLDALIDNAIKFNREGGQVMVSARRADGTLEICVADTGIGIVREDLAKLFKPLVQLDAGLARKRGGLGLGLALARRSAELHGGAIEVESELGMGSTFTVRLPCRHTDSSAFG